MIHITKWFCILRTAIVRSSFLGASDWQTRCLLGRVVKLSFCLHDSFCGSKLKGIMLNWSILYISCLSWFLLVDYWLRLKVLPLQASTRKTGKVEKSDQDKVWDCKRNRGVTFFVGEYTLWSLKQEVALSRSDFLAQIALKEEDLYTEEHTDDLTWWMLIEIYQIEHIGVALCAFDIYVYIFQGNKITRTFTTELVKPHCHIRKQQGTKEKRKCEFPISQRDPSDWPCGKVKRCHTWKALQCLKTDHLLT